MYPKYSFGVLVLLLLVLATFVVLVVGCSDNEMQSENVQASTAPSRRKAISNKTAWEHVIMRSLLADRFVPVDCRYENARCAQVVDDMARTAGVTDDEAEAFAEIGRNLILVRDAAKERALADALFEAGFHPEAAYHYRNILSYYLKKDDPRRKEVESRLAACARYLPETTLSSEAQQKTGEEKQSETAPGEQAETAQDQPGQPQEQAAESSRKQEEQAKKKPARLYNTVFYRIGTEYLVPVNADVLGIPEVAFTYYYAARELEKGGYTERAAEMYGELLEIIDKASPAYTDLHAKLARLYAKQSSKKAIEHCNRVLADIYRLGPEILCRKLNWDVWRGQRVMFRTPRIEAREMVESPVIMDEEERVWPSLHCHSIERLSSVEQQTPHLRKPGPTYFGEVEARRRAFLQRMSAILPEPEEGKLDTWRRIADCHIIGGDFMKALHLLKKISVFEPDAGTKFRILACSVQATFRNEEDNEFNLLEPQAALRNIEAFLKDNPDTPFKREIQHLHARALLENERREPARDILAFLASEAEFEFAPDAKLTLDALERRLIRINIPQALTTGPHLPIKVTLRNLSEVKFRFYRLREHFPVTADTKEKSTKLQIREFLNACKERELESTGEVTAGFAGVEFARRKTFDYNLPVPVPGLYIVEASGGGISCKFTVIRNDTEVKAAILPRSAILCIRRKNGGPLPGVKMFAGKKLLGTSDRDGLVLCDELPAVRCERCNGPCRGYSACRADWRKRTGGKSDRPPIELLGAGPGVLFNMKAYTKKAPPEAPAIHPLLYVYADRPVYQAGEVLHFRGIIRMEKENTGLRGRTRFEVLPGEKVRIEVKDGSSTLFVRQFTTGEFGTFHGEYPIPESAARKVYKLTVTYAKTSQSAKFEVRDFVKPDYVIKTVPEQDGLRVFAGYAWGAPVPGSRIVYYVEDKKGEKPSGETGEVFIPAKDGQLVTVILIKGEEELARKAVTFWAPVEVPREKPKAGSTGPAGAAKQKPQPAKGRPPAEKEPGKPVEEPKFAISADKDIYRAGEAIRLKLTCRAYSPWEALVVLGDYSAHDFKTVTSEGETATAVFQVCGAYDPAVFAWALFTNGTEEHVEKIKIPVRACFLSLKIEPEREVCAPGEDTAVTLRATGTCSRPRRAESSLAVVDEAIFTLSEDKTPDIYKFFYKERKGSCSFTTFEDPSFPGEEVVAQSELDLANWRFFNVKVSSYWLLSNKNLDSTSCIDAYGIGGGRSGAYGQRWGCGSLAREGSSPGTESAVTASLCWPHYHQDKDGKWDCDNFMKHCNSRKGASCAGPGLPEYDVLVTSQMLLSFLGNGHTHRVGLFKKTVKRGLNWLVAQQAGDDSIGRNSGRFWFLNHATATMALCEAYAVTRDYRLKSPAQRAVDFIRKAQNTGSGWGFEPRNGKPNSLMTGWAVLALKAAKTGGLSVDKAMFDGAVNFFDSVTDQRGWTYFEKRGEIDPDFLGNMRQYQRLPEWTAVAAICRIFCGQRRTDPAVMRGIEILLDFLPRWDKPDHKYVNFHYWYFATYAMFQYGGRKWHRWNRAMTNLLLDKQRLGGCADGSWNPVGKWGPLYGRVGTTALATLNLEIYYRYCRGAGGFGLRGRGEGEPEIRLYFPNTAFWAPDLVTGEDGTATARFKLPDTITSVRLTARAVTKNTEVGEAVTWIEVKKDFFVKLKTPKFFVSGDTATIHADIYNYTDAPREVALRLTGEGFSLVSDRELTQEVPNNGTPKSARWTVKITSKKEVSFTVAARGGGGTATSDKSACGTSDAMMLTIPVKVLGTELLQCESCKLKHGEKLTISLPEVAEKDTASLEVVLRPTRSNLYYILDTLRYIIDYPYGCVEQTMSRFLPSVVVADTLAQLEVPTDAFRADFMDVVNAGLKRLYNFQNKDGGWGWFSSDGSATFMSAYVVYGLARAKKAGIEVDQLAIDRGVEWLKKHLDSEQDRNMLAYAHFALANAGAPQSGKAKKLAEECSGLSSYAKALLALALDLAGEKDSALKVLNELEKDKIREENRVHFETRDWYYKWENVSVETTAYAMKAFIQLAPENKSLPGMAAWLISKREGNKWHTTKDSAAAIYGLIEYVGKCGGDLGMVAGAVRSKRADGKKSELLREIRVFLNDKHEQKVTLDVNNPANSSFVCHFSPDKLHGGANHISFDFDPEGLPSDLGCFATLRYTVETGHLTPVNNGLDVRTSYSRPLGKLRVGEEVTVTVEVAAKEDYDYLIISSPVPAGASVVRSSQRGTVAAFEDRFDQAIVFVTHLKAGTHSFKYSLKCNYPGTYSVLAPTATLMYNTNINGAGASKTIEIKQ